MAVRPFPVNPELTAIAQLYRNPDVALIADDVLPRTPTAAAFKYLQYDLAQGFTVPSTLVGRKSYPTEVEFQGTEVTGNVEDHALDDFVPNTDQADDNQGVDPRGKATTFLTGLLRLAREKRVADLIFATGTYPAANKVTATAAGQWSHADSDPVKDILTLLDVPVMRPNIGVFGQAVWTRLRAHPKVISAIFGSNQSGQLVTRQMFAELFELQAVYVGAGFLNTAKPGQTATLARVWGKSAAFLYRDRAAGPQAGVTFGFTADRTGGVQVGSITDEKRGVQGGETIRVHERVKEVVAAPALGYLYDAAIA